MMTKFSLLLLLSIGSLGITKAQLGENKEEFTRADTLRGSLNENRTWWDVLHYSIAVSPDFDKRTIKGKVDMLFKVLRPGKRMQIDLQEPMLLTKAYLGDTRLNYTRDGNVYYLDIPVNLAKGSTQKLALAYEGNPKVAKRAPWDGGWIFQKDAKGRPWMTVACQGLGASVWYPCKDHQSDEPDNGATMLITVPDTLVAVANGRLINSKSFSNGTLTWRWEVKNPINNYNLVPYIGKYV
ncbi:MAG: M1 family peptidase, partial [Chitinophagaceae bacterium]